MSKMGISTVASYTRRAGLRGHRPEPGAGRRVLHRHRVAARRHRPRRDRRRGGRAATRSRTPTGPTERAHRDLELGGEYQWRREGEYHLFNPETVFKLQHATRAERYDVFKEYTRAGRRPVDASSPRCAACSSCARASGRRCRSTRSSRSARSSSASPPARCRYGSISEEAHETLAIAMNRIGGKSNTGEGGEDADRFTARRQRRPAPLRDQAGGVGSLRRHQSEYLVNADDLQIKMAQGAKPGEGGQLPGHKVYPWIAKTRHSTPGVGLISPPPHHDIYSIEDLEQLIHDLKNANPARARAREARGRGRRRHGGRRRGQGARRRRAHLRPRRRHRRRRRSRRSSTPARRGSSAWPRRSRRCCSTACATASSCRPTAS